MHDTEEQIQLDWVDTGLGQTAFGARGQGHEYVISLFVGCKVRYRCIWLQ